MRVAMVGTFDPDLARNRTLLRLLRESGDEVEVCAVPLWGSRRHDVLERSRVRLALAAVAAYARLLGRLVALLARRPPDVVLVAYPGFFDMPVVGLLCRLRRVPVVFDMFISLHDTIVADRAMASSSSVVGRLARLADRVACRLATLVLADTPHHAEFFAASTGVAPERFAVLPVGAQDDVFRPGRSEQADPRLVLFYGTLIPLQGVDVIVRAAKLLEPDGVRVRMIGTGQLEASVAALVDELRPANLERVGLVPLPSLPAELGRAALALGVFGTSDKAGRVVPNKVYEALAVGRPVLTGDTPAARWAFAPGEVATCPCGDPAALAAAVRALLADPPGLDRLAAAGHARYVRDYSTPALARRLHAVLGGVSR